MSSWRSKWQNLGRRTWVEIRDSWLAHFPPLENVASRPEPGLEQLLNLQEFTPPTSHARFSDFVGLRSNLLAEAIFLFHKCSHTQLATQRIAKQGMHSWCLFNAYHSAYLGARGIMALLGVAICTFRGLQVAIDIYPEPLTRRAARSVGVRKYADFVMVRLPSLVDQRYLWEAFQRVLRMCEADCWNAKTRDELLGLQYDQITPPRNHFLYRSQFWPLHDLLTDLDPSVLKELVGSELNVEDKGFLLRLGFSVYWLFEQLMSDFADQSELIKSQLNGSRFHMESQAGGLEECYELFLSGQQS
jgi:hypothetical protein